jgi:hypothetical protein
VIRHALATATLVACGLILSFGEAAHGSQTCTPAGGASPATSDVVTLRAVGDIVLGNNWPTGGWPPDYEQTTPRRMKRVIGEADVVFGNFEGALTTHNESTKVPRGTSVFAFRMPPRFAQILAGAGFNVMAIANNHTFDFGPVGYADTRKHLAAAGMLLVGEPREVVFQTVHGVKLAWIGFSHIPRHNYIGDLERLEALMREARAQADLVIVSMQAGAEGNEALRVRDQNEVFLSEQRGNTFAFARRAVDLGADLVIGHGPHVLRGMECYKGKLIAYSLGNFIGYGTLSTRRAAALSAVLEVKLGRNRETLGFQVTPLRFDEERLPEFDPENLALHLINDLSRRPPLNGTVRLPVSNEGEAGYRRWLADAELTRILARP